MKTNKKENYLISNTQMLISEYPEQEALILECLYRFTVEPKILDSTIIVNVYKAVGSQEAKEWELMIKVNEGW
jgi:hypothetical protein